MNDNMRALDAAEQTETFVAFITGVKAKLVAQGWHEHHAEKAVIAMLEQSAKGAKS